MSSKFWKKIILNIEFYTKPNHQSSVRVEEKHFHICKALTFLRPTYPFPQKTTEGYFQLKPKT